MRPRGISWLLRGSLLAWLLPAGVALASPPDAAQIVRQGNGHGAPACQSCHGLSGGGQAAAGFPRLAGLNVAYLHRQLDDFANGSRANPVMTPIATALKPGERKALADYYGQLPIPSALAHPSTSMPSADSAGAVLATRGRWYEKIPACVACHGPGGIGVGANFPPLAGQSATYIAAQLKAWKQGSRHNDPLQLMQHISQALSDQDIREVSAWFAAQPLTGGGKTP